MNGGRHRAPAAAVDDGDQVDLTQLLGRKIRSSLIAQWESKIQQEIQSTY